MRDYGFGASKKPPNCRSIVAFHSNQTDRPGETVGEKTMRFGSSPPATKIRSRSVRSVFTQRGQGRKWPQSETKRTELSGRKRVDSNTQKTANRSLKRKRRSNKGSLVYRRLLRLRFRLLFATISEDSLTFLFLPMQFVRFRPGAFCNFVSKLSVKTASCAASAVSLN